MSGGHGGRRLRSGRKPDPLSARSLERRGALTELPPEGYDGPVPDFPLPDASPRELAVWAESWTTPQAAVWAEDEWRHRTVALWVRWSVRTEALDATAAAAAVATRLQEQIGLSPSGMVEQGWTIGPPPDRNGRPQRVTPGDRRSRAGVPFARDRLRVADDPDDVPLSALERARRRAEERARDPRHVLSGDDWPDGAS